MRSVPNPSNARRVQEIFGRTSPNPVGEGGARFESAHATASPPRPPLAAWVLTLALPLAALGQVNSGSDGSDGALNPTSNITIDMHDHPDGIYQYTSVNIPWNVDVTFIQNDANTPVVWLVQGDCSIDSFPGVNRGTITVSGSNGSGLAGGAGGPGGFRGGNGPASNGQGGFFDPGAGIGPGGGKVTPGSPGLLGGCASFGTIGVTSPGRHPVGDTYGNTVLLPLIGGSGGGGGGAISGSPKGGGGGGGAILIACGGTLSINGELFANGGWSNAGGFGSGGAIRLIATTFSGSGTITAESGTGATGLGRIRIEAVTNNFIGSVVGVATYAAPSVIVPPAGQAPSLSITSVAGLGVPGNPSPTGFPPDVVVPAAQQNPINIVVNCHNVPLNSQITVEVKPNSGAIVSASGTNNTGTVASSTAVVTLDMPPGEGTIQAKAVGCPLGMCKLPEQRRPGKRSLAETGLAASGERFSSFDVVATLGGSSQVVYVTDSGKRFPATWLGPMGQ